MASKLQLTPTFIFFQSVNRHHNNFTILHHKPPRIDTPHHGHNVVDRERGRGEEEEEDGFPFARELRYQIYEGAFHGTRTIDADVDDFRKATAVLNGLQCVNLKLATKQVLEAYEDALSRRSAAIGLTVTFFGSRHTSHRISYMHDFELERSFLGQLSNPTQLMDVKHIEVVYERSCSGKHRPSNI